MFRHLLLRVVILYKLCSLYENYLYYMKNKTTRTMHFSLGKCETKNDFHKQIANPLPIFTTCSTSVIAVYLLHLQRSFHEIFWICSQMFALVRGLTNSISLVGVICRHTRFGRPDYVPSFSGYCHRLTKTEIVHEPLLLLLLLHITQVYCLNGSSRF